MSPCPRALIQIHWVAFEHDPGLDGFGTEGSAATEPSFMYVITCLQVYSVELSAARGHRTTGGCLRWTRLSRAQFVWSLDPAGPHARRPIAPPQARLIVSGCRGSHGFDGRACRRDWHHAASNVATDQPFAGARYELTLRWVAGSIGAPRSPAIWVNAAAASSACSGVEKRNPL